MLSDQDRQKLDGIVQQMTTNKEPDQNIQAVVDDFKTKYDTTGKSNLDFAKSELDKPGILKSASSLFESTGDFLGSGLLQATSIAASKTQDVAGMEKSNQQLTEIDQKAVTKAIALRESGDIAGAERLLKVVQSHGGNITFDDIIPNAAKQNVRQITGKALGTALEWAPFSTGGLFARGASEVGNLAKGVPLAADVVEGVAAKATKLEKVAQFGTKIAKTGAEVGAYGAGMAAAKSLSQDQAPTITSFLEDAGKGFVGGFALGAGLGLGGAAFGKAVGAGAELIANRRTGAEKLSLDMYENVLNRSEKAIQQEKNLGKNTPMVLAKNGVAGDKPAMFDQLRGITQRMGSSIQSLIEKSKFVNVQHDLVALQDEAIKKVNTILDEEGNRINRTEYNKYISSIKDSFQNAIDSYGGRTKINTNELNALKQDFWEKSYNPAEEISNDAKQLAGTVLKDRVEKTLKDVPTLPSLNAELGDVIHARKTVFKSLNRPVKSSLQTWLLPFATMILKGGGAAAGSVLGGPVGAVEGLLAGQGLKVVIDNTVKNPAWRTYIAKYLARYAQIARPSEDKLLLAMQEQIRQKLMEEGQLLLKSPEGQALLAAPKGVTPTNVLPTGEVPVELPGRQARTTQPLPAVIELPESQKTLSEVVQKLKMGEVKASELQNTVEGLKQAKKQYVQDWLDSEQGAQFEIKQKISKESADVAEVAVDQKIVDGIKNNPYFKKEGEIKDVMGQGWVMQNSAGKTIIAGPDEAEQFVLKGYQKTMEVDSLAKEAGYDNGTQFLQDQLDMSAGMKTNTLETAAAKELSKIDKNFGQLDLTISQLADELKSWPKEKMSLEQRAKFANKANQSAFGAIAGIQPYQDKDGKWRIKYDQKAGFTGVALMAAGQSEGGKKILSKVEELVAKNELTAKVADVFKSLLDKPADYRGIGKELGMTSAKVQQAEKQVLEKLGMSKEELQSKLTEKSILNSKEVISEINNQGVSIPPSIKKEMADQNFSLKKVSIDEVIKNDPDAKDFVDSFEGTAASKKDIPIIIGKWQGKDNSVMDGWHRLAALKNSGETEINAYVSEIKSTTPDPFKNYPDLSTKIIGKLEGKTTVSKQFISDLTNSGDVKQVERDIIREALANEGDKVNVAQFADKVKAELLPLKRVDLVDTKYESISLPVELRGRVQDYRENIYSSPIKTSAGDIHFSAGGRGSKDYAGKSYFGHTRIEDMARESGGADGKGGEVSIFPQGTTLPSKVRRVIEVQSDLYQKGGLDKEINRTDLASNVSEKANMTPSEKTELDKFYQILHDENRKLTDSEKQRWSELNKKNLDVAVSKRTKEIAPLQQYNDPTAHFRMIREEVKQAAIDGKTALQFPTGDTAMKIEGLGGRDSAWGVYSGGEYKKITVEDLNKMSIGTKINDTAGNQNVQEGWIITEVLGDGKFKAVPNRQLEFENDPNVYKIAEKKGYIDQENGDWNMDKASKDKDVIKALNSSYLSEEFSVSSKINADNPIYKFYEKEVGKYLKNKYDAKLVTDDQGVTWWELPIKKEQANLPVEAFGVIPAVVGGGAVAAKKSKNDTALPKTEVSKPLNSHMDKLKVPEEYRGAISSAAKKYGIAAFDLLALLKQENSQFKPDYVNPTAQDTGLGQHIPDVIKYIKEKHNPNYDPTNAEQNIEATAWLMDDIKKRTGSSDIKDIMRAYHVGVAGFQGKSKDPKAKKAEGDKYVKDVSRWLPNKQ